MKKNKKILSIVILATLILLMFLAGYTFARYYKNVEAGTATARIARWSFGAGNTQTAISLQDGAIAPGDSGLFNIEVDATNSEVPVDYQVKFTNVRNIPRNMKFKAITEDENGVSKETEQVSSLQELSDALCDTIPYIESNQKRFITVIWNWDFNEDETLSIIDNEDGTLLLDENGEVVYDEYNLTSLDIGFDVEIIGRQQTPVEM